MQLKNIVQLVISSCCSAVNHQFLHLEPIKECFHCGDGLAYQGSGSALSSMNKVNLLWARLVHV